MKTKNAETSFDIFNAYVLTNEEMMTIRGGEGDLTPTPTPPPIKI